MPSQLAGVPAEISNLKFSCVLMQGFFFPDIDFQFSRLLMMCSGTRVVQPTSEKEAQKKMDAFISKWSGWTYTFVFTCKTFFE